MDYGKYKYEAAQKARESRRNQANAQLKEIRISLKIEQHDYETKVNNAKRFLDQGDKVKIQLRFKGREQLRPEMGVRLLERVAKDTAENSTVESLPRVDGRNMVMVLAPIRRKSQTKSDQRRRREAQREGSRAEEAKRAQEIQERLTDQASETN